ncbi:MAG: hypothetical protein LBR49_07150, partial [Tannerella sp.]|nr:hypothetical protein [Tannerella sp.]
AASVESIEETSFSACKQLKSWEVKSAFPPNIAVPKNVVGNIMSAGLAKRKVKKAALTVPKGTMTKYKEHHFWKKFKPMQESAQAAINSDQEAVTFVNPCNVHLRRMPGFSGCLSNVSVYLNGEATAKVGCGETVDFTTDRLKNMVVIKFGKSILSTICFDAAAGGDVNISLSTEAAGIIKLVDSLEE